MCPMHLSRNSRTTAAAAAACWIVVGAAACAGAPVTGPDSAPSPEPGAAEGAEAAGVVADPDPESDKPDRASTMATSGMSPPLPGQVEAGTIPRRALQRVLEQGPGRLLARVRMEPARREGGEFIGWRLVEVFPDDRTLQAATVLRAGDLLVRVNGHSIARPEQLMSVWESLGSSAEIVFHIVRGDQPSEVRYLVSDQGS